MKRGPAMGPVLFVLNSNYRFFFRNSQVFQ